MLLHLTAQPADLLLFMVSGGPPLINSAMLTTTQTLPTSPATNWDPAVIAAIIGAVAEFVPWQGGVERVKESDRT